MMADMEHLRLIFSPSKDDERNEMVNYEHIHAALDSLHNTIKISRVPLSLEAEISIKRYRKKLNEEIAVFASTVIPGMPLGDWSVIDNDFLTRATKIHLRHFTDAEIFMTDSPEYEQAYLGYFDELMELFENLVVPQVKNGQVNGLDSTYADLIINRARVLYGGMKGYYVPVTTNTMARWYHSSLLPHSETLGEVSTYIYLYIGLSVPP